MRCLDRGTLLPESRFLLLPPIECRMRVGKASLTPAPAAARDRRLQVQAQAMVRPVPLTLATAMTLTAGASAGMRTGTRARADAAPATGTSRSPRSLLAPGSACFLVSAGRHCQYVGLLRCAYAFSLEAVT
jgi:hypothetical protein